MYRRAITPAMGAIATVMLYLGLTSTFPSLPAMTPNYVSSHLTYFPNCDAARAAGVAPIHRGEPGYRPSLDRDSDGIACEPWPRR